MNENVLLIRRAKEQLSGKWGNVAIAALVFLALNAVADMSYFITLIVYGPLCFGFYLYLAAYIDTGENNLNLLFKGFERFGETLIAGLLYIIALTIGTILLIIPGIILALGLSMTFFIMVDEPEISGFDALKKSWDMMRGQKWNLFCLWLRLFGWFLLSILTCGIGFIFYVPYQVAVFQNFYRKLRYGTF